MLKIIVATFAICLLSASGTAAPAQEINVAVESEVNTDDDVALIQSAIESYVTAFNAKDVNQLVDHWSTSGVYVSRSTGDQLAGRDALKKGFAAYFEGDQAPKLAVVTESIDFISPSVARELGTATVTRSAEDVVETSYSAIYIKENGSWLIDRVTEAEIEPEVSHAAQLQPLAWLIGDWVDSGDGVTIEMSCQWTRNQNYISRKYTVTDQEQFESSGLQIIGWDAAKNELRSWLFDSNGIVVTGTWTQRDQKWIVQSVATLADGTQGSFTSVFEPFEDGNYGWRKINRVLDGKLLPNLDQVVVQRK